MFLNHIDEVRNPGSQHCFYKPSRNCHPSQPVSTTPLETVILSLYSEDDTADSQQVLSFVGAAQAPSKYKILESCPSLETEENMRELIGAQILHAWDDDDRQGWFEGRVCLCMGATAQPQRARSCTCSHSQIFYSIQKVLDSWRQEQKNYSTLSSPDKQDIW